MQSEINFAERESVEQVEEGDQLAPKLIVTAASRV